MRRPFSTSLLLAVALGWAAVAQAQGPRQNSEFQFRFGAFFPAGGGQFWDDVESTFTLNASDFEDFTLGFTYLFAIDNRFEIGFNLDFYDETVRSAYRDYTDQAGRALLHDTRLETAPATVDFRWLPSGRYAIRGTSVQRHLRHPAPYLGAGAGFVLWQYEEVGDFIDFSAIPNQKFSGRFVDDGVAFETHLLAGIELPLGPSWNFLAEGRYSWAKDTPGGDFAGLGSIELGGFSGYFGFGVRF